LGIKSVDATDTFLDLGGHSLLIMRARDQALKQHRRRLSPRSFVFKTLRQIAAEFDRSGRTNCNAHADTPCCAIEPARPESSADPHGSRQ